MCLKYDLATAFQSYMHHTAWFSATTHSGLSSQWAPCSDKQMTLSLSHFSQIWDTCGGQTKGHFAFTLVQERQENIALYWNIQVCTDEVYQQGAFSCQSIRKCCFFMIAAPRNAWLPTRTDPTKGLEVPSSRKTVSISARIWCCCPRWQRPFVVVVQNYGVSISWSWFWSHSVKEGSLCSLYWS